jgi:hypothetical protein
MSDTKLTVLLATTLFLASAPEPDSGTIAEITANFIVPVNEHALMASDRAPVEAHIAEPVVVAPRTASNPVIGREKAVIIDGSVDAG